jgi:hypothetical protein
MNSIVTETTPIRLDVNNPFTPEFRSVQPGIAGSHDVSQGIILGGGQHVNEDGSYRYDIAAINLDDNFALGYIPLTFLPHAIVFDPVRQGMAAVFEKWGRGACLVDLFRGEVTHTITTDGNRQFYGHGAYSPDSKLLYCTETDISDDFRGLIAIRDAANHDYIGEFPSHGASPHDCHLVDEGRTMVITNGGGPRGSNRPCVTWVDTQSEQLIEKRKLDTPDLNTGHMAITPGGDIAVVSAPRKGEEKSGKGGISISDADGNLHAMTRPASLTSRLRGETLSVCIDSERNVVVATTPDAGLLTFWDLHAGRLLKYFELKHPRGVTQTLDGKHYVVSYGNPVAHMSLIDCETLEQAEGYDLQWTGITGSHIFAYQPEIQ